MGRAGVDPDVEGVAAARQRSLASHRAGRFPPARRRSIRLSAASNQKLVPLVRDLVRDGADDAGIEVGLLLRVEERRDGHAPRALPADAPVGPRFDGAADAGLAPRGDPLDLSDRRPARPARAPPLSSETNHWSTARKTMGVLERQQCG